jgi:hypothetical protein
MIRLMRRQRVLNWWLAGVIVAVIASVTLSTLLRIAGHPQQGDQWLGWAILLVLLGTFGAIVIDRMGASGVPPCCECCSSRQAPESFHMPPVPQPGDPPNLNKIG